MTEPADREGVVTTKHGRLVTLIDLTVEEVAVLDSALFDYQMETERYLQNTKVTGHDPCCETARARQVEMDKESASLRDRWNTIRDILNRLPDRRKP